MSGCLRGLSRSINTNAIPLRTAIAKPTGYGVDAHPRVGASMIV